MVLGIEELGLIRSKQWCLKRFLLFKGTANTAHYSEYDALC